MRKTTKTTTRWQTFGVNVEERANWSTRRFSCLATARASCLAEFKELMRLKYRDSRLTGWHVVK
jgi:hypothetical protein